MKKQTTIKFVNLTPLTLGLAMLPARGPQGRGRRSITQLYGQMDKKLVGFVDPLKSSVYNTTAGTLWEARDPHSRTVNG